MMSVTLGQSYNIIGTVSSKLQIFLTFMHNFRNSDIQLESSDTKVGVRSPSNPKSLNLP